LHPLAIVNGAQRISVEQVPANIRFNSGYQVIFRGIVSHSGIHVEFTAPDAWRLTSGEAAVFAALLTEDTVDGSTVAKAASVTEGSVDVLLHRLRKKVSPHRIEIETVRGKGWRLVGRETWRLALAAITAQPAKGA
jgi:hypothetical protein